MESPERLGSGQNESSPPAHGFWGNRTSIKHTKTTRRLAAEIILKMHVCLASLSPHLSSIESPFIRVRSCIQVWKTSRPVWTNCHHQISAQPVNTAGPTSIMMLDGVSMFQLPYCEWNLQWQLILQHCHQNDIRRVWMISSEETLNGWNQLFKERKKGWVQWRLQKSCWRICCLLCNSVIYHCVMCYWCFCPAASQIHRLIPPAARSHCSASSFWVNLWRNNILRILFYC